MTSDEDVLNGGPASIADRAAGGEGEQQSEEELFPKGSLPGDDVTPQTFVRKGLPVELTVSLMKAEVPFRGSGLANPNKFGRAIVSYLPAKKHDLPVRDDKNDPAKVTAWKITQDLRIVHVAAADDPAELIRGEFEVLLAQDEKGAAALFAELREMAEVALGAPVGG